MQESPRKATVDPKAQNGPEAVNRLPTRIVDKPDMGLANGSTVGFVRSILTNHISAQLFPSRPLSSDMRIPVPLADIGKRSVPLRVD